MSRLVAHPLLLALLLAVAVRILPATDNYVIGGDEALYLTLGGHLAAGDGFTADGIHPHSEFDPGYPLFAALIYRVTNTIPYDAALTANDVLRLELPARLNLLVLGALLVIPIYFMAQAFRPGDRALAIRAALLTATVPAIALGVPNFEAVSEQLYSLALWSGWLFLWLGLTRSKSHFFLASGIAFGLAHLTRWEGLVSAGTAVIVAMVWLWHKRRLTIQLNGTAQQSDSIKQSGSEIAENYNWTRSKIGAAILSLIAGVLLLAAPYALYQTARTGSVFSTKSIVHQLHGEALASNDPFAWEKAYDNYERVRDNPGLYPPLPVYLWENRTQTAINYARNTINQLRLILTSPTFLFVLWLPFAILGMRQFRRSQNLFLAATLTPALVFPLSVVDARYLLPLVPAGMIWTASGLMVTDRWLGERAPRLGGLIRRPITTALLAGFVICDLVAMFLIPRPTEYRSAGLALRGVLPPHAPVLMRRRPIAFYANVSYESLPFSDLPGVLDYARQKTSEYFIVDARTTPMVRPQLAYLLNDYTSPQVSVAFKSGETPRVIVYRILR